METETDILIAAVRKAGTGDANARSFLYRQFSKAMFNICIRMTGNKEDAEDILQECFIIAFKKIGQLKEERSFGGWLKRIVISECIRFNKKDVRWKELDDEFDEHADDTGGSWMQGITFERIYEAIKTLPEGCRQVFNLYAIENYPHRSIAEELNISESTSKSQYHRAKSLLKEKLLKHLVHG